MLLLLNHSVQYKWFIHQHIDLLIRTICFIWQEVILMFWSCPIKVQKWICWRTQAGDSKYINVSFCIPLSCSDRMLFLIHKMSSKSYSQQTSSWLYIKLEGSKIFFIFVPWLTDVWSSLHIDASVSRPSGFSLHAGSFYLDSSSSERVPRELLNETGWLVVSSRVRKRLSWWKQRSQSVCVCLATHTYLAQ